MDYAWIGFIMDPLTVLTATLLRPISPMYATILLMRYMRQHHALLGPYHRPHHRTTTRNVTLHALYYILALSGH